VPRMLQARTIGEILDDVFRQYRSYFVPLMIISLVFLGPIIILQAIFMSHVPALQYQSLLSGNPNQIMAQLQKSSVPSVALVTAIGSIALLLVQLNISTPLTDGSYYLLTGDTLLHDLERPAPWSYVRGAVARWGAYLGTIWLMIGLGAAITALLGLFVFGMVFLAAHAGPIVGLLVLLYVVVILLIIWLGIRLLFAIPVVFFEKVRNWAALKRSFALTSGSFWRLFFIILVSNLIFSFASTGLAAILNLVLPTTALRVLGSGVITILLTPLMTLLIGNLYIDMRIRREGYDLEIRTGQV